MSLLEPARLPAGLVVDTTDRARQGIRISLRDLPRGAPMPEPPIDCAGGVAPDACVRALEYAVVDVETTGGSYSRGHRVTEFAAVRIRGDGTFLDEYRSLLNPERPIPPFITTLTSISWEMVRDAPRFGDVAGDIGRVLRGAVFVAHNAPFDWRFVGAELGRAGVTLTGSTLCTVRLARKVVPELRSRSLDSLAWFFDVHNRARHRAWGDAIATAEVLRKLLDRLDALQVGDWSSLQRLLAQRSRRRRRRRAGGPGLPLQDAP